MKIQSGGQCVTARAGPRPSHPRCVEKPSTPPFTPFSVFPFPATGEPDPRTEPQCFGHLLLRAVHAPIHARGPRGCSCHPVPPVCSECELVLVPGVSCQGSWVWVLWYGLGCALWVWSWWPAEPLVCRGQAGTVLCTHCHRLGSLPMDSGLCSWGAPSPPQLTGEGSPCSWGAETWARVFTTPEVTVGGDAAVPGEQDGQGAGGEGPSQVTQGCQGVSVSP